MTFDEWARHVLGTVFMQVFDVSLRSAQHNLSETALVLLSSLCTQPAYELLVPTYKRITCQQHWSIKVDRAKTTLIGPIPACKNHSSTIHILDFD